MELHPEKIIAHNASAVVAACFVAGRCFFTRGEVIFYNWNQLKNSRGSVMWPVSALAATV